MTRPLANITAADLGSIWARREITTETIARTLGVPRQAISYRARVLGLPSRAGNHDGKKKCSDEDFARIWNAGVAAEDIAKHFGYSASHAVTKRRAMMGLDPRIRGVNGWVKPISLAAFLEDELGRKMAEELTQ